MNEMQKTIDELSSDFDKQCLQNSKLDNLVQKQQFEL